MIKAFAQAPNYGASKIVSAKYEFGQLPTDGLVGLWTFDDLPTNVTKDCSSYGNDGLLVNVQSDINAVSNPSAASFTGKPPKVKSLT